MLDAWYDVGFHNLLLSTVQFVCALRLPQTLIQKTFLYLSKKRSVHTVPPILPDQAAPVSSSRSSLSLAFSHVLHIFRLWADTLRNCPRGPRRPPRQQLSAFVCVTKSPLLFC